jgi:hypothetical protein
VWISLAVPLAVLLAAMLLQRLEAALLTAPDADEHPHDPAVPPLALVSRPDPPPARRQALPSTGPTPTARATA